MLQALIESYKIINLEYFIIISEKKLFQELNLIDKIKYIYKE
jgi:hypothetical protein